MDISLLRTFLEVAKRRHFGRAAEALFVTQSAVSARIKLLEETLGVDLFVRKRNDIQLTPAGNRLHLHAEGLVKGWDRARQAIALDNRMSASLAVGCVFDLWAIYVEAWAGRMGQFSEQIAIQIEIQATETLVQRLLLGILDLAFVFDPPQTADLELRQVADVPLILYSTRPGQSVEQAMGERYVMVDWGSAFGIVHAERFPGLPPPLLRTNSGQVAVRLLHRYGGSAYLPRQMVDLLGHQQALYPVDAAPVINRPAFVFYRPENQERLPLKRAIQALV
ncbi:MAG: LysR family transcriptional regulator [Gammaproteobacteria bacterium]|nr:LysR family transcriptional regulator [Gammaproteobacteria bacterium]